jgi:tRNA1Val (adenine37-N6)-methyltransferase
MGAATRDHFLGGRVVLHQPASGYRFSIDAVILAHMAQPAEGERVLDLGTGCGVIPILLAFRHPTIHLTGIEIQPALATIAQRNVTANQMDGRIRIVEADMTRVAQADIDGPVDLVVSNPPYRRCNSGRINPDSQKAMARHELAIDLPALLDVTRRFLRKGGRMAVIYPSVRAVDLLTAMHAAGIEPKTLTVIHSKKDAPARLVVVTGVNGGGSGLDISPPLAIYDADGMYTPPIAAMVGA